MKKSVQAKTRIAFVDFMYAIVIGSAFGLVPPLEFSFRFFGLLFLILVVLEDFYLYHHTQIVGRQERQIPSFLALVAEIAILLTWYMTAISFPDKSNSSLACFSAFFALKWVARFAHLAKLGRLRSWEFNRNLTFMIPMLTAVTVIMIRGNTKLSSTGTWLPVMLSWFVNVLIWWGVTGRNYRETE